MPAGRRCQLDMHLSRTTEEDELCAGWNRLPVPFLSPCHIPTPFTWVHEHCKSRSSETNGGSGHRLWAERNPEGVQQFGKTPSQSTIILKNLSKKPAAQWGRLRSYCGTFSLMPRRSTNHLFLQYRICIFMWSHDSRKWSFIQNSRNLKPGYIREDSNMCPGTAIPAVCWQKAAGLGINQINRGWRKNILPSPRTPC